MMDLDNIVENEEGVIHQKQKMYIDLTLKYDALLDNNSEVLVSYSINLPYEYQQKLVNIGSFLLWADLNGRSTVYKNDNPNI